MAARCPPSSPELFTFLCGSRHVERPTRSAEETDELDDLLDSYDQAAQADKQKVEAAQKVEKKVPTSMKDLRAEGLANPLTASNRCEMTSSRGVLSAHSIWLMQAIAVEDDR